MKQPNLAEQAFTDSVEADGWEVSRKGWPDFFCKRDGRVMLVEVKKHVRADGRRQSLKPNQIHRMEFLSSLGADCFVALGDELIEFDAEEEWEIYRENTGYRKAELRKRSTI